MAEGKKFVGVNPDLIRPLNSKEEQRRGWKVELIIGDDNVADITRITSGLRLFNEKMGIEVVYGRRAEGYDGVVIHEPGGGGSVTIPFVIWNSELWIGLVEEERKNMGGRVLDAPGGFLDPGQTHFETATREFEEEVGVTQVQIADVSLGEPANSNRAWFDTSSEEEGAHFYPIEFLPEHVESDRDCGVKKNTPMPLRFKEGVLKPKEGDRVAEKIFGCRFYHWSVAATKSDLFANAMFSRLFAYLVKTNRASDIFGQKI